MDFKTKLTADETGLLIVEYIGNAKKCVIPQDIDGAIVKFIDKFAFSEKRELTHVELPESVENIGAHAFYNCRELKSISLADGVVDIGDGAFKNCYNISEINIKRKNSNTKCLKGILSELNNEVTVTIQYADGAAKLVFPYYLYNYEENTPARIINQVTEGSGIRYRECIGGTDVNYAEYDKIFLEAMHIDVQESAMKIAMGRLEFPYNLSDVAKEQYTKYLSDNGIELTMKLIKNEKYDDLRKFLLMKLLDNESLKYCINKAREDSFMEGLGILLAFQRDMYGTTRKVFEF